MTAAKGVVEEEARRYCALLAYAALKLYTAPNRQPRFS